MLVIVVVMEIESQIVGNGVLSMKCLIEVELGRHKRGIKYERRRHGQQAI